MNSIKKFYTLSIDSDSGYKSFNSIVESAMDDPKFSKIYPVITNQKLLEELIQFIQSPPRKIKGLGIANGEMFKKENGRQVSGSHRYWGVLEENGTYNLYKKFKGGPFDGQIWLILRAQDESYQTAKFILEYAKAMGDMPRIIDVDDYFLRKKTLVCRDRIQIILNHCHDAVIIASRKKNIDYDVAKISSYIPQHENRDPYSNVGINATEAQKPKKNQSSSDAVSFDNTIRKKLLKQSTKSIVINTIPLKAKMTPVKMQSPRETETMKPRTPMVNRLRKRKAICSNTDVEDSPKATLCESNECVTSSMTSKKHRRK